MIRPKQYFFSRLSLLGLLLALSFFATPASSKDKDKPLIELGTSEVVHLRVGVEPLGGVPNSGLLLPEVSRDGKWIAYLEVAPGRAGGADVAGDSVITGKGLERVSLSIRELKKGATAKLVCPAGAAWPAWFPDGKRLAFVVYDKDGRAALAVHDLERGETKRWGVGLKHLMMPSVSPEGRYVAVVGYAETANAARLILVEPGAERTEPGPALVGGAVAAQFSPQWLNETTIVYAGIGRAAARTATSEEATPNRTLYAWSLSDGPERGGEALFALGVSAEPAEWMQAFVGIARSVNPRGDRFAYYGTSGAIVLMPISEEETKKTGRGPVTLEMGTHAGVWVSGDRFAAATEKKLSLYSAVDGRTQVLLNGSWLPRWSDEKGESMVVLGKGEADGFEVSRVTFQPAGE